MYFIYLGISISYKHTYLLYLLIFLYSLWYYDINKENGLPFIFFWFSAPSLYVYVKYKLYRSIISFYI